MSASQNHAKRADLGKGARRDAPEAPHEALLAMRRQMSALTRVMVALPDAVLLAAKARETRGAAIILAELGVSARHMALALEPLCPDGAKTAEEIHVPKVSEAATLPPHALRHLVTHSALHLDVCLRDLPGQLWRDGVIQLAMDWKGERSRGCEKDREGNRDRDRKGDRDICGGRLPIAEIPKRRQAALSGARVLLAPLVIAD